jgi:hypothetical protein
MAHPTVCGIANCGHLSSLLGRVSPPTLSAIFGSLPCTTAHTVTVFGGRMACPSSTAGNGHWLQGGVRVPRRGASMPSADNSSTRCHHEQSAQGCGNGQRASSHGQGSQATWIQFLRHCSMIRQGRDEGIQATDKCRDTAPSTHAMQTAASNEAESSSPCQLYPAVSLASG